MKTNMVACLLLLAACGKEAYERPERKPNCDEAELDVQTLVVETFEGTFNDDRTQVHVSGTLMHRDNLAIRTFIVQGVQAVSDLGNFEIWHADIPATRVHLLKDSTVANLQFHCEDACRRKATRTISVEVVATE